MLALTIKTFNAKDAYEEFDEMRKTPKGWNANGQRAYMMRRDGGHPADYYPRKVTLGSSGDIVLAPGYLRIRHEQRSAES